MRDSQRSKVYRAERVLTERGRLSAGRLETVEEMQAWVDSIIASPWWKKQVFGRSVKFIKVESGAGQRRALAYPWKNAISMPRWSRSKGIILHEMAHLITARCHPSHGWQFCASLLMLVEKWCGKEDALALKNEFSRSGVKFREPRKRVPLTSEQKEVLVARLALARESKAAKG